MNAQYQVVDQRQFDIHIRHIELLGFINHDGMFEGNITITMRENHIIPAYGQFALNEFKEDYGFVIISSYELIS